MDILYLIKEIQTSLSKQAAEEQPNIHNGHASQNSTETRDELSTIYLQSESYVKMPVSA